MQKQPPPPVPEGVDWAPGWSMVAEADKIIRTSEAARMTEPKIREKRDRLPQARRLVELFGNVVPLASVADVNVICP